MNDDVGARIDCRQGRKTAPVIGVIGFCLPISGIILACCICLFIKMPIPVENAVVLLAASLFMLAPLGSERLKMLQKITGFYLVSVCVNELASQHFRPFFLPAGMSVSYTVVVLLLCAIGCLVDRINSPGRLRDLESRNILYGWLLVLAIAVVHILVLAPLLNKFYGYGYERDLSVLGNLCLYFLLFIFLWERLGEIRFRQITGLVLALTYFGIILINR